VEAALAIEREWLGHLSEDVAQSLGFLARLHEARGDWAAARDALQELLALRERQPDRRDWRVVDARWLLADLNRRAAMMPEQRQGYWKALQLNRKAAGLHYRGQYRAAEVAERDSSQTLKDLLGEDHPQYATALRNLGTLYNGMGDSGRAEPHLRRSLEILEKAMGENHPDCARSLNELGMLYRNKGDYRRAELLIRRALEIDKKTVGEDHPDFATGLYDLGT
jgi:tetratricopeptide (TPR) repeat protein